LKIGIFHVDTLPKRGGGYVLKEELLQAFKKLDNTNDIQFLFFAFKNSDSFKEIPQKHYKFLYKEKLLFNIRFFVFGLFKRVISLKFFYDLFRLSKLNIVAVHRDCLKEAEYRKHRNAIFEKQLRKMVDCFLFLEPLDVFVTKSPYVCINWDFAQFEDPYFPEFLPKWFKSREIKLTATQKAMRVINGTQALSDQVNFHAQVPKERQRVLPFPTPADALEHAKMNLNSKFKMPIETRDNPFLFYPASFWPHKNHASLLRAMHSLKGTEFGYDLIFCGANKGNKKFLQDLSIELGLNDHVHFLDFITREQLLGIYSHAAALVFPSLVGPDNIPPLEAFAIGCPVIAGKLKGSIEQFNEAAYLYDPLDEKELIQAIKSLRNDKVGWNIRLEKGKKRAQSWTSDDYAKGVCQIFSELQPFINCCDVTTYEFQFS
jgi:glycosyltransferase involved in cell wall biosynthesis